MYTESYYKFTSYVKKSIEGVKLNYIKKICSNTKNISLCENIEVDSDTICEVENKIIIKNALKVLTERQKNIIKMHHFDGQDQVEIASSLNISKQAVNKSLKRSYKKMKLYLEGDEYNHE